MPFDIPDHDVSFHDHQSIWYSTDIDILAVGYNGVGVVDGCAVTAQGSPDMTVAIAAGNVRIASGTVVAVTAGNGTITTADATNPRIDLVSVSEAGTKTVTAGTAASGPKPPDLPSGHVALAAVYVPANDTTIASNQITDKRVVLSSRANVQAFIGAKAYSDTTQSISDATSTAVLFELEEFDTDGFHSISSNTSRFTIPAGLGGKYLLQGSVTVTPGASPVETETWWRKNGSTTLKGSWSTFVPSASTPESSPSVCVTDLVAGDYVELAVYQDSSGSRNIGSASVDAYRSSGSIVKLDSGKVGSGIGARVIESSATQTITTDSITPITFDEERFDTDGFHSTSSNTSRLTIPAGLGGIYAFGGNAYLSGALGTTDFRELKVRLNATTDIAFLRTTTAGDNNTVMNINGIYQLVAGDYIELDVQHSAGANRTLENTTIPAEFWLARLDSGSGQSTVGTPAWAPSLGWEASAGVTNANLGTSGGTFATQVVVPARMYLRSLVYRATDTATARSMEWGLYLDQGGASCPRVAYGTDSFTPGAASNRTSAVSDPTTLPVVLQPGVYWLVMRNTGGATNFGTAVITSSTAMLGMIGIQTQALGSALGTTLDMTTGWTRTSANVFPVILRGNVFGEAAAY